MGLNAYSGGSRYRLVISLATALVAFFSITLVGAQDSETRARPLREVRTLDNEELGLSEPASLAYSLDDDVLYVLEQQGLRRIRIVSATTYGMPLETRTTAAVGEPQNVVVNPQSGNLLFFDDALQRQTSVDLSGVEITRQSPLAPVGVQQMGGVAVDTLSNHVFLLDAARQRIIRVPLTSLNSADRLHPGSSLSIGLSHLNAGTLSSLAINPQNRHLYILSSEDRIIFEVNMRGRLLDRYELESAGVLNPQSLVIAPSSNPTDDPAVMNLYVVDGSRQGESLSDTTTVGRVVELTTIITLDPVPGYPVDDASLVRATNTYQLSPPSPDPSGLAYLPDSNSLIISDGEVNEIPHLFTGDNLFEITLGGALIDTLTSLPSSNEPTGIALNPTNGHLFISDDTGMRGFYEVNPGPDGQFNTGDDIVTSIDMGPLGSTDPEGVAYDTWRGHIYVVDGVGEEVYEIEPGPNGIFQGFGAGSDDIARQFDTGWMGISDPEGIEFNPDNGHLYIMSGNDHFIAETMSDGTLIRYLDFSSVNSIKPAGLAYAPASANPAGRHIYIVDRAVDNNQNPNENDGRMYEVSFPLNIGNLPPSVTAGADQTILLGQAANLDGTASDDGLPNPPGAVSVSWSRVSGPGTVTFANASALDTTVTFSAAGTYVLRLTASDSELTATDDVTIAVSSSNQAPLVAAGSDQTIILPDDTVSLDGTVSDDGLPNPPGAVTTTWSRVSGPGTVTFGSVNAVDTTASFSASGVYILRLTANDGQLNGSDDLTVTVIDPPPGGVVSIQIRVNAATDDAEESTTGGMTVNSSDLELVADGGGNQTVGLRFNNVGIPSGATITHATIQFQVDESTSVATDLIIQGQAADNPPTFTTSNGNISSRPRTTSSVSWSPPAWNTVGDAGPDQQTSNIAVVLQEVINRPGWNQGNSLVMIITGSGERVAEAYNGVPAAAPLLTVEYFAGAASNQAPTVNAGPDQAITLPTNSVNLDGTVTDDGLPNPPGAVSTTWSRVSGPGAVTFGNANAVDTTTTFSVAGVYVLRLSASDGDLSASDDVTITVNAANQAPAVNAGPDQAITLPTNSVNLDGTVTDDGLPNPPGAVSTTWSRVSGPGTVTFGNAAAVDTTATFSAAGVYVLRLTASDGALSDSDDLAVTVSASNQAPTVDAGPDQTVTLPTNSVNLDGTVTDDGLPNPPGAVSTTWSRLSGPGTVTFGNAGSVDTTATFSTTGVYVLRLTATDGDLSATDDLTVTLSASNQAPIVDAGPDQAITLPTNNVNLNGTVTDDGLPNPPGAVSVTWNHVSGQGTVTFGNANAVDTTATFSAAGVYGLRLTASDGTLSSSDDLTVTVNATNQPPIVNAGLDQAITLPTNNVNLNGTVTDDGLPNPPGAVSSTWSSVSGPGIVTFGNTGAVDTTAMFSATGVYVLRLTASDGELNSSDDVTITVNDEEPGEMITFLVRISSGSDDAEESANGNVSLTSSDLELVSDGSGNQTVGLRFNGVDIPRGATITNATIQFQVDERTSVSTELTIQAQAVDNAPAFSNSTGNISSRARTTSSVSWTPPAWNSTGAAGPDQQTPNIATVLQEVVNRPGWSNGNALAVIITGSGERVAEAYNGVAAAAPLLTVEYATGPISNQPPNVDAGADQEVTLPSDTVALIGTVTDDGLPNPPGTVSTSWSRVSGPGTVTFGNVSAVNTTATFSTAGAYVLRLTANDGGLSSSDDVAVTVNEAPPGGIFSTQVRVNAGSDDAEESANGNVSLNSSDLELVSDGSGNQTVGLRFNGVDIPQGAMITNATIQFQVDERTSVATSLTIQGQAVDNAPTFASSNGNISSRPRTTASVSWSPPAWNSIGAAGPDQQTPNIAAVLQEVIARPGWNSGNSLAVIITGSGERVAEAYNGIPAAAPLLIVEYSLDGTTGAAEQAAQTVEVQGVLPGTTTANMARMEQHALRERTIMMV